MKVAKAQPPRIYPDAGTPLPNTTITGQAFKISVDVENPNPVTIKGKIMLNFTKPGITLNDVDVYSDAICKGYKLDIRKVGVYGDTLVFIIQVNCIYYSPTSNSTCNPRRAPQPQAGTAKVRGGEPRGGSWEDAWRRLSAP